MLEQLKRDVCEANLRLVREGLVILTWGNASGLDRASGRVVIKPSGVSYDAMTADDMAVVSLETGEQVEGDLKPSSDTPTHLEIYRAFEGVGGIVHTHSTHATAWAQAEKPIPPLGTTHADAFHGPVPVTRRMTAREIEMHYEGHTGAVIAEALAGIDPLSVPAVLVAGHGPFTWGRTVGDAVASSVTLEAVAEMAALTLAINADVGEFQHELLDKHFLRKHGPDAYYGQG